MFVIAGRREEGGEVEGGIYIGNLLALICFDRNMSKRLLINNT